MTRRCTRCNARLSIATPLGEAVCRPCARATRHHPPPPVATPWSSGVACAWCNGELPTGYTANQRYCSMRCSTAARRIADMYRSRRRRAEKRENAA